MLQHEYLEFKDSIHFSYPLIDSQCDMNYAEGMDSENVYLCIYTPSLIHGTFWSPIIGLLFASHMPVNKLLWRPVFNNRHL